MTGMTCRTGLLARRSQRPGATQRREPFGDVLSQLFCQFDFSVRCVSGLGDSDRRFRLSFAGIVSAGFAVALIRVDERGSQAVSHAASSWDGVQVVAHRASNGAENLSDAEVIWRKIRALELDQHRQSHRPEAQQRPVQLQQRMFGPVAAQLAAVEGLLETSVEQFDSPAPGIERQHLRIGESRSGDTRHQRQWMVAIATRDQPQYSRRVCGVCGTHHDLATRDGVHSQSISSRRQIDK